MPSVACGTRPAEFFNGWARKLERNGSEKRSSENLIRQRGRHQMTTRHTRVDFSKSCSFAQALQRRAAEMGNWCRFSTLVAHFKPKSVR
ncbi:MAG: hypothetical protein EBY29_03655 [Planctomycetes bacterium]|nr:hypothetical protein [Planctomycetota bacterium]